MLTCFLSSTEVCNNGRQFFLHGPTSELVVCNLPLNAKVSNSMKQLAEQEWGIHKSKITLTHKGKEIKNNHNAAMFLHDSNIYVSIKQCLSGGGEECEICGEKALYYCHECKQEFCGDCCSRVHQHKKELTTNHARLSLIVMIVTMLHAVKEIHPIQFLKYLVIQVLILMKIIMMMIVSIMKKYLPKQ